MWRTIALLVVSNTFMTIAWYGHLRHKQTALWIAIAVSWLIASIEYCFQVPANRIGSNAGLSAAELKTIQEVITLIVFVFFAWWYLGEAPKWNVIVGFAVIFIGATLIFKPWDRPAPGSAVSAMPTRTDVLPGAGAVALPGAGAGAGAACTVVDQPVHQSATNSAERPS